MKHVLFVCSRNRLRSPTAEYIFSGYPGIECQSAGTNPDAEVRVSVELVQWADLILAMEKRHQVKVRTIFRSVLGARRVISLDIPDEYEFMDPKLVELLKVKVEPYLR